MGLGGIWSRDGLTGWRYLTTTESFKFNTISNNYVIKAQRHTDNVNPHHLLCSTVRLYDRLNKDQEKTLFAYDGRTQQI